MPNAPHCLRVWNLALLLIAASSLQGQVTLSLVRETYIGQGAVPDGTLINSLDPPLLARSGVFAHRGRFVDGAYAADGIFVESTRIARGESSAPVPALGDVAPGTGGRFQYLGHPFVNSSGQVAFYASSHGSETSGSAFNGIFAGGAGALQPVALGGGPAPGTAGVFQSGGFFIQAFNDAGEVVFRSSVEGAPAGSQEGIWMGAHGAVQLVAREGSQAPGFPDGVTYVSFSNANKIRLNAAGQIAFTGHTTHPFTAASGPGTAEALWVGTPGALEVVARSGDAAPGTETGTYFYGLGNDFGFNVAGQVALSVALESVTLAPLLSSNCIYWGTPGDLKMVARAYTQAAGVETGTQWTNFAGITLNASGEVAFRAFLETADGVESQALYVGKPGQLRLIARTGTQAPGGEGDLQYTFFTNEAFSKFVLSDSGQVAFLIYTRDSIQGELALTLFATDKTGVLHMIAREDSPILGSALAIGGYEGLRYAIYPNDSILISAASNGDGLQCSIDGAGNLVFKVKFAPNEFGAEKQAYYLASFDDSAPVIPDEGQPASVTGVIGGSATFQVTALGTRTGMAFQWKHNDQILLNETSDTLKLTDLTEAHRGSYTVSITNAFSQEPLESVPAMLSFPPVIGALSPVRNVSAGSDVDLAVTASGVGTLTYQWKFKGPVDAEFANIANGTDATLPLTNVATSQTGRYRVRVSNSDGTVTSGEIQLTVAAQGQPLIERIAFAGDRAAGLPGNVFIAHAGAPLLNDNGEVLVEATLANAAGSSIHVYGTPAVLAGLPDDLRHYTGNHQKANLSDSGKTVVSTTSLGSNPSTNSGITYHGPGTSDILGQEGSPSPNGGPTFYGFDADVLINADGTALFAASLAGAPEGLYLGKPGTVQLMLQRDQPAPGLGAGITFDGFGRPVLNDLGTMFLTASIQGAGIDLNNNEGLWTVTGTGAQRVLAEGDQPPGLPAGVVFGTLDTDEIAFTSTLGWNSAGQTAFVSHLRGPGVNFSNETAIFAGTPGALQLVAREGGSASGRTFDQFTGTTSIGMKGPMISSTGYVAFTAFVSGFKQSIWLRSPDGTLKLIALQGQQAPGCPAGVTFDGYSPEYVAPYFDLLGVNEEGQVAFSSFVAGAGISEAEKNYQGLWMTAPNGLLKLIARAGDPLDIGGGEMKIISNVSASPDSGSGGEDGRPRVLSDNGELVFSVVTDNGNASGVFRATLPDDGTSAPLVTTQAATSLTKTAATLHATVNPGGLEANVHFEYGATAGYGTATAAQVLPAGAAAVPVSRAITGLTANTTYHYRAVATNALGTVAGADMTFTTASNSPPFGGTLTLTALDAIRPGAALTATFSGWSDEENHTPLSYLVQVNGADQVLRDTAASVNFNAPATPGTYTLTGRIYDSLDSYSEVSQTFVVLPPAVPITPEVLWAAGGLVPGAGQEGSGVPADAKWTSFGPPSVNDSGDIAFLGSWTSPGGKGSGIFLNGGLVASAGMEVADGNGDALPGLTFAILKSPVLGSAGEVAFLATVKGAGVKSANKTGLWRGTAGGALRLLARTGMSATGDALADRLSGAPAAQPEGVSFASLLSYATAGGETAFAAKLAAKRGLVSAVSDLGIWSDSEEARVLMLREGQTLATASGNKVVKAFSFIMPMLGTGGQPRALVESGTPEGAMYAARVTFTDRVPAQAVIEGSAASGFSVVAMTGQSADSLASEPVAEGMNWLNFGMPGWSGDASNYSFLAKLAGPGVTKLNDSGVFADDGSGGLSLALSKGEAAPDTIGGTFASFLDPVAGGGSNFAVQAKIAGRGIAAANASGLWWRNAGELSLLARAGSVAAETGGAAFKSFSSLAYAAPKGPLFVARLLPRKTSPGAVSAADDIGLWAMESSGALRLLLREGDQIGGRTVVSFTALGSTAGSASQIQLPGNPIGFNSSSTVVCLVAFSDRQSPVAIVKIEVD